MKPTLDQAMELLREVKDAYEKGATTREGAIMCDVRALLKAYDEQPKPLSFQESRIKQPKQDPKRIEPLIVSRHIETSYLDDEYIMKLNEIINRVNELLGGE